MKKLFKNCPYADIEFLSCRQCEKFYSCSCRKRVIEEHKRRRIRRQIFVKISILGLAIVMACLCFILLEGNASEADVEAKTNNLQVNTTEAETIETHSVPMSEDEILNIEMVEVDSTLVEMNISITEEDKKGIEKTGDVELLARVIHGEASICDDAERYNVGTTAMNRIELPGYPDTLEGVIFEDGQYGCVDTLYDEEPTEREYEIAYDIIVNNVRTLPAKVVFQTGFMPDYGILYLKTEWHYYCYSIYIGE